MLALGLPQEGAKVEAGVEVGLFAAIPVVSYLDPPTLLDSRRCVAARMVYGYGLSFGHGFA